MIHRFLSVYLMPYRWLVSQDYGRQISLTKECKVKVRSSCYEGLEMNLLWLLRLVIDKRAHNISENSSQQCESEFRHVRSLTGVQSTQINCIPKIFLSRLHKIELCELKDEISFSVIEQR